MLRSKGIYLLAAAALTAFMFIGDAMSQTSQPAGGGRTGRPGRGGPGGGTFDPAKFKADQEKQMKDDLGVTDDEWKVLQPKIEKVQTAQREARGGFGGFGRPRNGDNGAAPAAPAPTEVEKKMTALSELLKNKDAKPDEVKAALAAYREARDKARADLEKAQKDLKDVLTIKQEAQLVTMRVLE